MQKYVGYNIDIKRMMDITLKEVAYPCYCLAHTSNEKSGRNCNYHVRMTYYDCSNTETLVIRVHKRDESCSHRKRNIINQAESSATAM